MTSPEARKSAAPALDLSATKAAVWLSATAFLALLVLYFVGMDQGATSVFGSNTVRARVRARRPPSARLPLPLIRRTQPTQWKNE